MTGDAVAILRLYGEMIEEVEAEDLSKVWPVRLGEATEQLNLDWFAMKHGPVSRRGDVVVHSKYDWAAATLDAWLDKPGCPVEAKHVGGHEPLETIIGRYQPQMQWQMECTGATECALSVIMGAAEPVVEFIPTARDYTEEMMKRGAQFMDFVRRRVPPVTLPAVPSPVDATKTYNMIGNNFWASQAATWLINKASADACKTAEKELKALVPPDAKFCYGHAVTITRDRAGRLALREEL